MDGESHRSLQSWPGKLGGSLERWGSNASTADAPLLLSTFCSPLQLEHVGEIESIDRRTLIEIRLMPLQMRCFFSMNYFSWNQFLNLKKNGQKFGNKVQVKADGEGDQLQMHKIFFSFCWRLFLCAPRQRDSHLILPLLLVEIFLSFFL